MANLRVAAALLFLTACSGGATGPHGGSGPVATVAVAPAVATVVVGDSVQLAATLKDGAGNPLIGRVVTWTAGTPAIASVSATGLATGRATGTATITATSEGQSGSATVNVGLVFAAMSAALDFTCGRTTGGAGYCWGLNASGQLGNGSTARRR